MDKGFRNFSIVFVILLAVALATLAVSFNGMITESKVMSQYVGREIVIRKDTLMITDYSMLGGYFRLSNGTKVYYEFVEKQVIK